MILPRTLLLVSLAAILCGSAHGAVTITANEALTKGDDPRLDRKVTYSADGLRIADVLAKLSETTGVTMNAGQDKNDWMVYDRKVIVRVRDMKLIDLMREISSVLRFHWSRGGDEGKWTYLLWQDKEERTEEESLRSAAENTQTREYREKRENAVADLVNLGSLSANDAASLKSTDPWRYVLATEPLGRDVAEFINSFPEARNAFVQGLEAGFPVSTLPTPLQEVVRRIAVSYDSLTKSIGGSEDHSALLSHFDRLQITINHRVPMETGTDVLSRSLLGRIMIGSGAESFEVPLFDPASPMAKALGTAIVSLKSGKSKSEVAKQLQADITAATKATTAPQGAKRDITSDPALRAAVKLFDESTKASLPMALGALADRTKLNVVSDYFASLPVTIPAAEQTLGEQLEAIRAAFGSSWEKTGSLLRFRDQDWFKKRTWEVPRVWIDYWTQRGKINDGLQFQDLLQIGNLRDEQIDHTIILDPTLMRLGAADAARNRQILKFYGVLSDDQRKALSTQQLEVSTLTDDQWAALQKALATKGAAYAAAARGSQSIGLTQSSSDVLEYTFTYYPGKNDPPVVFKLTTGVVFKTGGEVVLPAKKIVEEVKPVK